MHLYVQELLSQVRSFIGLSTAVSESQSAQPRSTPACLQHGGQAATHQYMQAAAPVL
jgi:hypothetical protein